MPSGHIRRIGVGLCWIMAIGCAGYPSIPDEALEPYSLPVRQAIQRHELLMNMASEAVGLALGETACRLDTRFHGNPAQAWGYKTRGSATRGKWPLMASAGCAEADFWVYFEKERVVGWSY